MTWSVETFPQYSAQPFVHILLNGVPAGEGGRLVAFGPNGKIYGFGDSGTVLPATYETFPGEYVYFLPIGGDFSGQVFNLFFSPDGQEVIPLHPPYIFQDLDFRVMVFHGDSDISL